MRTSTFTLAANTPSTNFIVATATLPSFNLTVTGGLNSASPQVNVIGITLAMLQAYVGGTVSGFSVTSATINSISNYDGTRANINLSSSWSTGASMTVNTFANPPLRAGATVIPVQSATGFRAGAPITGTGLAPGTTMVSVNGNNITISPATTADIPNGTTLTKPAITTSVLYPVDYKLVPEQIAFFATQNVSVFTTVLNPYGDTGYFGGGGSGLSLTDPSWSQFGSAAQNGTISPAAGITALRFDNSASSATQVTVAQSGGIS